MAIIFELFIETESEAAMAAMETYWSNYQTQPTAGPAIVWTLSKHSPKHLCLWSPELGDAGIESYAHAITVSECGIDLAMRLLEAPDFLLARIGIEVDGYTKADFLREYQQDGETWIPDGMILCERFWQELNCPVGLVPFRPGYYWNKYRGESISPVFHEPALHQKWSQLPG